MAQTQVKASNILDHTLTGASFREEFKIYDETKDYTANTIVWYQGAMYNAKNDITGTIEGDLSNAPDISSDWEKIDAVVFRSYPSSSQTFNNIPVVLGIDSTTLTDPFNRVELSGNNLLFNASGNFMIHYEITINNTTTTRVTSKAYLEISTDGGSSWNTIPHTEVYTYNRTSNAGTTTGSLTVPLKLHSGDMVRVSVVCNNNVNVSTVVDGCNVNVFTTQGTSGPKGEKGDTGQPGDLDWQGDYDSGRIYNENEVVYYQGSSYVSLVNNNSETPSDTATNWDIVAHKGDSGAGASISVYDEGSTIPNTPHSGLDFTGEYVQATDAGSGIAKITILPTKHQYMVPIWAEENGALGAGSYEWAFGNGANTPSNRGIAIYVPSGYICELVAISATLNAGSATIDAQINGSSVGSVSVDTATSRSNTTELSTPYEITNADRLNFRTSTQTGTSAPNTVTAWLRYTEK